MWEEGMERGDRAVEYWNRSTKDGRRRGRGGNPNSYGNARSLPRVIAKKIPNWLHADSPLTKGQKRSAIRWYLYWFQSSGMPCTCSQHTQALQVLRNPDFSGGIEGTEGGTHCINVSNTKGSGWRKDGQSKGVRRAKISERECRGGERLI